jgi:hypothetical protein
MKNPPNTIYTDIAREPKLTTTHNVHRSAQYIPLNLLLICFTTLSPRGIQGQGVGFKTQLHFAHNNTPNCVPKRHLVNRSRGKKRHQVLLQKLSSFSPFVYLEILNLHVFSQPVFIPATSSGNK